MSSDIKIVGLANPKMTSKTKIKIVSSIIGVIVLAVGVIAGIFLVRQNQNINEQASCVAECPNGNNQLVNCAGTADTDGEVSDCNGRRVEVCGQTTATARQYCCPSAGGNWTTNLSRCSVAATATATATATSTSNPTATATATGSSNKTSTPTSTAKATKTATAKATSTSSSTAVPVPVTGVSLPTILGTSFGIIMILVSLALAL